MERREDLYFYIQRLSDWPGFFWNDFRYMGYSCEDLVKIGMGWRLGQILQNDPLFVKNYHIGRQINRRNACSTGSTPCSQGRERT
jgi:hypothetical protein